MTGPRVEAEDAHCKLKDQIEQAICRAFCNAGPQPWLDENNIEVWFRVMRALVTELEPLFSCGKRSHKFAHRKGVRQPKGTA